MPHVALGIARRAGASAATLTAGDRLRQWELVEFAGGGSLSLVYRARPAAGRARTGGAYALKVLQAAWEDEPAAIAAIAREVEVGRAVAHRHVVPILSASLAAPPYFVVMPWLCGQTLKDRLHGGTPPIHVALWFARQAASGLAALHARGWRHGDIKPGNLFVSPEGHLTLIDLGFARPLDEADEGVDRSVAATCGYVAPELLVSRLAVGPAADIYSLGAVLYEMLAGRPPFSAGDVAELVRQHRQSAPPRLEQIAPHVPAEMVALVQRMLAKDPLRRPESAAALEGELARREIDFLASIA